MTIQFDERHYSYDSTTAEFQFDSTDVATDDRSMDVWWDAQPTVDANEVPSYYNDFFDADAYYAIDTTVAKSVPQQYWIGDEEYTFLKPPEELRKATWSLDGKPYTLTHPSEGAVRSTDEIHGFWGQPRFDEDTNESDATLYFPTNDSEARSFVADHDEVSVGFINTLVQSDQDDIHAEQTDIYYDHVASVKNGRCSKEDGCGLKGFASGNDSGAYVPASTIPVSEMKGPVNVSDPDATQDGGFHTDNNNSTMTVCNDCGNDNGGKDSMTFSIDDFGVRKVRKENDAVDEVISEKESEIDELETQLEDAEKAQDLLSKASDVVGAEDGGELLEELNALQDDYEAIQKEMESHRTDERDDLLAKVESLADGSAHDRFEQRDDESVTDHIDRLTDAKELLESAVGDSSATTTTTRSTDSRGGDSEFSSTPGSEVDVSKFDDIQF